MNISRKVFFICLASFLSCVIAGIWFINLEIFTAQAQSVPSVQFTVERGETASALARRLADEQIVRHAFLFERFLAWKGVDTKIRAGEYVVTAPITIARVADALANSVAQNERTVTIIPGWDLRDVAAYLEKEGFGKKEDVYAYIGESARIYNSDESPALAHTLPNTYAWTNDMSLEGYLAPDTYRVYRNATLEDVLSRLINERKKQLDELAPDIATSGMTVHDILTLASILEQEVRSKADKAKVADIFLRRLKIGMALQADSTVHYTAGKNGTMFTTAEQRKKKTPWNTYAFPGLPPSPICNPGVESIVAVLHPEENDAWYFLTTGDGEVKYGRTLEEHNANRVRYL